MVNAAPVTLINYELCRCSASLSLITRVSYLHPRHLFCLLFCSLALRPSSLTAAQSQEKCLRVDGRGIKFSSIQFHFSLYCRLVIELIDSSCQHPLIFFRTVFTEMLRQGEALLYRLQMYSEFLLTRYAPLLFANKLNKVRRIGSCEKFESASETRRSPTQAVFYNVRKWMRNNCFGICHFTPSNERFCPRRLAGLQVSVFLAHSTCHVTSKLKKI